MRKIPNTPAVRRELGDALVQASFDLDVAARALGIRRQTLVERLLTVARRPRVE